MTRAAGPGAGAGPGGSPRAGWPRPAAPVAVGGEAAHPTEQARRLGGCAASSSPPPWLKHGDEVSDGVSRVGRIIRDTFPPPR